MTEQALIPNNILARIQELVNAPANRDTMMTLDATLVQAGKYGAAIDKIKDVTLAVLEEKWPQLSEEEVYDLWRELKWCDERDFSWSFESYAIARTGWQWVTIRNRIRVARTWYLSKPQVPKKIELTDPDTGEATGIVVEGFDIDDADVSKLLLCTPVQKRGEMTKEVWGLLANPDVTDKKLRARLMNSHAVSYSRRIIVEDGMLCVIGPIVDGSKAFGTLELGSDDEDVRWGVERVLKSVGAEVR